MTPLEVIRSYPPHEETLWSFLESRARARPEHPFIVFQGSSITYRQFASKAERASALLAARGVRPGDRIGVMMENDPMIALAWFALARLGAIMVPVNPAFGPAEAGYTLSHSGASGVLCAREVLAVVQAATKGIESGPWILSSEAFSQELASVREAAPASAGAADATCVLVYTSGTTGYPKGVMHAQRSVVLTGEAFVVRCELQPEDRMLCVLPMFHVNALFYSLFGSIAAGATLVLEPRFSASAFWKTVAENGVTQANLIAAASSILMRRPRAEFVPGHSLWRISGAPFSAEMHRVFGEEFGVPMLLEGYGMSEIPGVASTPVRGVQKQGSAGPLARHPDPARPFSEMEVADDRGAFLGDNQTGELVVKTPILMQGYFRDPEQTAAAFRDGWFLTGDLGYRDADGYFWFVARKKDIIRRRGENISGAELDRVIGEHPDVLQAAAIAVPSELGEDEILVAVIARPGASLSAAEVADWCRARLAPMKVPRFVALVESLPHTPTHRVEKFKLGADPGLRARAVDLLPGGPDTPSGARAGNG